MYVIPQSSIVALSHSRWLGLACTTVSDNKMLLVLLLCAVLFVAATRSVVWVAYGVAAAVDSC